MSNTDSRLLTDEEMFNLGMEITEGGGKALDILEIMKATIKAQDAKTLSCLKGDALLAKLSPTRRKK